MGVFNVWDTEVGGYDKGAGGCSDDCILLRWFVLSEFFGKQEIWHYSTVRKGFDFPRRYEVLHQAIALEIERRWERFASTWRGVDQNRHTRVPVPLMNDDENAIVSIKVCLLPRSVCSRCKILTTTRACLMSIQRESHVTRTPAWSKQMTDNKHSISFDKETTPLLQNSLLY